MKDIYISSFCDYSSLGSMLQSLGLQKTLEKFGFRGITVKCALPKAPVWQSFTKKPKSAKQYLLYVHKKYLIGNQLNMMYGRAMSFIDDHINMLHFSSYHELKNSDIARNTFISGSDQVWNPLNMLPEFFLAFMEPQYKRISYAASMGVTEIPDEKKEQFAQYIEQFDSISVREQDMVPVISKLARAPVHLHVDPVFLLNQKQWEAYEKSYPNIEKPYILVYAIYWDKKLNRELYQLHKTTGMDIVCVSSSLQNVYANRRIYDAGPAEFLWLIRHAEMVVSSSFHGLAMSIIFNKKFSAVLNPAAPSRIQCLLDTFDIENLSISQLASDNITDYDRVNREIAEQKKLAVEYLKEALDADESYF